MFKLSPRRNQRSNKGFKVKHALHICVLGGICIWLLYQLHNTRNNNKESYEESTGSISNKAAGNGKRNGFVKLGRKDLDPRIAEMTTEDLKNGGQDAEEGKSFDDENKAVEPEHDQEKVEESERQKEAEEEIAEGEVKVGQDESNEDEETGDERVGSEEIKEQNEAEQEKSVEEENRVGKGEETEKENDGIEEKGEESNKGNGSENGGQVKEVQVEEKNEKRDTMSEGKEKRKSKIMNGENGKLLDATLKGNQDYSQDFNITENGKTKEQDEAETSPKKATNHEKSTTQVKNGKQNNLTNVATSGGTGKKTTLPDSSNPTNGTIESKEQQEVEDNSNPMEAKEQQQVQDKSRQTKIGSAGSRGNTNLVDNSNPTVGGSKAGNEHQQEQDNSGSIQTGNKPLHNVDPNRDGKETVLKEQGDSSDANSTNEESTSNSTSGGQSSVSAVQTEMTETKQILDSGEKTNLSNDNDEITNPGENNSTDSSTSQNEESSSGSTADPNDGQQNQLESSSSVLQEETDARTDMETMPQTETAGNNHEAAE